MTDFDTEQSVGAAFDEFRTTASTYLAAPGMDAVRARVRLRRAARTGAGVSVAAVLIGASLAANLLVGGGARPVGPPTGVVWTTPGPAASQNPTPRAPTTPPAATATPPGAGSVSGLPGSGDSAQESPDLSISTSYADFGPVDAAGWRQGSLIVRIDNLGSASAQGLTLTVRTPDGMLADGPDLGGCRLSGSAGRYQCGYGPLAAGDSVTFRFTFVSDLAGGKLPSGEEARRWLVVAVEGGEDRDDTNNEIPYEIRG